MKCSKCKKESSNLIRVNPIGEAGIFQCEYCISGKERTHEKPSIFNTINTREERIQYQLEEWVKGNCLHNNVDNECCPDFGCCNPSNFQPEEIRKTFFAANDEQRESMLFTFLGHAIANYMSEKKVFITNGKDEIIKDDN